MSTEFCWWVKDPEKGKYEVCADVHGGNITWERQEGRFTSWIAHAPTDEDWNRLITEAETRVPRRLLSPKQFEAIKHLREQALH
jgi:hypothetical protein